MENHVTSWRRLGVLHLSLKTSTFLSNLSLFDQSESPPSHGSGPVCKAEGRLDWRGERTKPPGCPEQSIARSHHQDSPTSSACGAVAPTLGFCLRLPRVCFSPFVPSAAQTGTVLLGALRRTPPLLPPVPAILERPAIGGNRCQLLGKRRGLTNTMITIRNTEPVWLQWCVKS